MNKTFKVVFNRSRGSLMVANEITSSVQKKGTKTVLATAVLALMGSAAIASDIYTNGTYAVSDDTTIGTTAISGEASNRYAGISANSGNTTTVNIAEGKTLTIKQKLDDISGASRIYLIDSQSESKIVTNGNIVGELTTTSGNSVRGLRLMSGEAEMNGNLALTVDSGSGTAVGTDTWDGGKLTLSGDKTDITVKTTGQIYGIQTAGGNNYDETIANFNAKETKITADASSGTSSIVKGLYSNISTTNFTGNTTLTTKGNSSKTYGLCLEGDPSWNKYTTLVNFTGDINKVDVTATGGQAIAIYASGAHLSDTGKTFTVDTDAKEGYAIGLLSQYNATTTFGSDATITAKATGAGSTIGVWLTDYTNALGNATFNKSLTVKSTSENSDTMGILYNTTLTDTDENGVFTVVGKTTVEASATGTGNAFGLITGGNKKAMQLGDAEIGAASIKGNARAIVVQKNENASTKVYEGGNLTVTGNVNAVATSLGTDTSAYAVEVDGGTFNLGAKDKTVSLTAVGSDARAFNITNGGTFNIGSADSLPTSVTLGVNKDSQYLGVVEGTDSAVNIFGDTYTQAGSTEGIVAKDGGAFNLTGNTVSTGNLSATNGGTVSVKADKSLNLTGNIKVTEGTNPALVKIESVKSTISGNVNVAGTGNTASIKTGDGSTFTGNLTATKGGKITLDGGAYTVSVLDLDDTSNLEATNATINLSGATKDGNVTLKGTTNVTMTLATAFEGITLDEQSQATASDSGVSARLNVTSDSEKTAKITVSDTFTYTGTILKAMEDAYSYVTLALENARLKTDTAQKTEVSQDLTGDVITGGGDISVTEAVTVKIDAKEDSAKSVIGAVDLGTKAANLVTANTTATIDSIKSTNTDSAITLEKSTVEVSKAIENAGTLTVDKGTTLKAESITSKGTVVVNDKSAINVTTLDSTGLVTLTGQSTVKATTLTGTGTINVGSTEGEGLGAKLDIETLKMTGGRIFVDPLYGSGYGDSVLHIGSLEGGKLSTGLVAGRGALVIVGATETEANNAVDSLGVYTKQPFVYVGTPINLKGDTTSGYVVIDTNATTDTTAEGGSVVLTSGALVIDQQAIGDSAVFTNANTVYATGDATIGVVNSKADTSITLATKADGSATSVTLGEGTTDVLVATDSPFVKGSLDATTGKINLKGTMPEEAMDVLASTGVQTMIRHADSVLAETIADRAICPQKKSGLWVSVRGEQYKQTKLGNGAGLKANMGYGAFGGELALKGHIKLGGAIQYGFGTVKGDTHNVKNKTKDYSATVYGTYDFARSGVKLLAEVAYTQSENKITNSFHSSLNQNLDAKMYSAGLTVMKGFKVGDFNITPSLGVRASRIETDAMKVGAEKVKKQEHDIIQVPIAVRVASKGIKTQSGAVFVPHAKVAYVPTFGDKELKVYDVKRSVINTNPVQAALGVSYIKGKLAVDFTANGGIGNRGTKSVGAKVGLMYRF